MQKIFRIACIGAALAAWTLTIATAQDAEAMARKLQDPLANIQALFTDNGVEFNSGNGDTSYSFQLQPVYAVPFEKQGFNLVNRAVVPILGMVPGSQKPVLGEPLPDEGSDTWGLGDSSLQFFFSPRSDAAWKWGLGPMFTLKTRTDSRLAGPGWGAGAAAVLVGNLSPEISTAFIGGHVWGEENGFSTSIFQPMFFYNLPGAMTLNYNNVIAYDWSAADSSNAWTVPLGLGVSKTISTKGGLGIDFLLGYYYNVERPEGAADSVLKWAVSFIFP